MFAIYRAYQTSFKQNIEALISSPLNFNIIKQDRQNGWIDWAEIFCGHTGVAGECYMRIFSHFLKTFYFHWQNRVLQLVLDIFIYVYCIYLQ